MHLSETGFVFVDEIDEDANEVEAGRGVEVPHHSKVQIHKFSFPERHGTLMKTQRAVKGGEQLTWRP